MGGLILGATRKTAAEYSFIAAVPIMFAATFYELYSSSSLWAQSEALYALILGFVVSFLAALLAIKGFTALLTKVGLAPFAWYRIIIAILVWYFWVN